MLDLRAEFAALGFDEDTDEDKVTLFAMDFPEGRFITVSDDNGKMPERAKANLVVACYDEEGRYLWGSEFKTFMDLQKVCLEQDGRRRTPQRGPPFLSLLSLFGGVFFRAVLTRGGRPPGPLDPTRCARRRRGPGNRGPGSPNRR